MKQPKSGHGIREVPLSPAMVSELRVHLRELPPGNPDSLAFPNKTGGVLSYPNLLRRVLKPALGEAGASWAGCHTFRHSYCSMLLRRGVDVVTASKLMGHHSPAFTLARYSHVLPNDAQPALDLDAELEGTPEGTPAASCPVPLSPPNGRSRHDFGLHGNAREHTGSVRRES
jgi:integrase